MLEGIRIHISVKAQFQNTFLALVRERPLIKQEIPSEIAWTLYPSPVFKAVNSDWSLWLCKPLLITQSRGTSLNLTDSEVIP